MGQFILPKDIPLDRYPKPEVFLEEGKRITEAAQQQGIVMRVMGPLALHYYFPDQVDLYARLERLGDRYFTDIDYASYGKTRKHMVKFMETVGYECDLNTMAMTGQTRHIYFGGPVPMIDVFFDKLDYCHEVDYAGRLELDPWSVTLADILLQKLQIWEINDKDLKDIEFLFTVADFGEDDHKKVNVGFAEVSDGEQELDVLEILVVDLPDLQLLEQDVGERHAPGIELEAAGVVDLMTVVELVEEHV